MADGRDIQTMEVNVGRLQCCGATIAARGGGGRHRHLMHGTFRACTIRRDSIYDVEYQLVAGINSEGWSFDGACGALVFVAVVRISSRIDRVSHRQAGVQNSACRIKAQGILDYGTGGRTCGTLCRCC